MSAASNRRVAVVIPCLNEELTIGRVLDGFRTSLPEAHLYVIDNNSSDKTPQVAAEHGAVVLRETRPGKGFAVRKAFREVEADIYLLVDGDNTYPAEDAGRLIQPILDGVADVVVGTRLGSRSRSEFRWVNRAGNRILLGFLNAVFGARVTDLLSGYRAATREFVKHAPVLSAGYLDGAKLGVQRLDAELRLLDEPGTLNPRPRDRLSNIRVVTPGFLKHS